MCLKNYFLPFFAATILFLCCASKALNFAFIIFSACFKASSSVENKTSASFSPFFGSVGVPSSAEKPKAIKPF
jgi:hypothetical protein